MTDGARRFPGRVYRHGTEPDARFSLANERTFLAWIRTSLALLGGGVALESLALGMHPGFRLAASVVLILTGMLTPLQAWIGWSRTERALRLGTALPAAMFALPIGIAVVVVGVLVFLGLVLP
ncbi:MAG: YidH family protein [Cellulomonas sp.]